MEAPAEALDLVEFSEAMVALAPVQVVMRVLKAVLMLVLVLALVVMLALVLALVLALRAALMPLLKVAPVQVVMPVQVLPVATNPAALARATLHLLLPRLLHLETLLPHLMLAPKPPRTAVPMTATRAAPPPPRALLILILTLRPLLPLLALRTLVLALAAPTLLAAMTALDPAKHLPPKVLLVPRTALALAAPTLLVAMTAALRTPTRLLLLPTSR